MNDPDAYLPQPQRRFETTQWHLVHLASQRSTPEGRAAFSDLCQRYWFPLYAYVRQNESDVHRAQDLTQSFFAKVMEKNYLADADPNRGRFRTFMRTSLRNFMANEWDRFNAQRRGGGQTHLSMNMDDADYRLSLESIEEDTPESHYNRRWAIELLRRVLNNLKKEVLDSRGSLAYDQFKHYLLPGPWPSYREVAESLGMKEGAVKVAVGRLRKRYQALLRDEIRQTVLNEDQVEEEIDELFRAFSR